MNAQRILVTAALPYANGQIHLGHLAGAYLPADLYVRFQRLRGRDIVFVCGSDEHGVAITITAEREKIPPSAVVDRYHALNAKAFEGFGMSFDNYSRTSLPLHHQTTLDFFMSDHQHGLLREKKEKQFYDTKAQMFLPDRYVEGECPVCQNPEARGDQCEKCGTYLDPMQLKNPRSKVSGLPPEVRETTHLYFPLGEYQRRLEAYIAGRNTDEPWKENVLQYCRGWFKDGLQDRAVTRDLDWGVKIPIPGYEHKVVYVWFDAVLGYISSTKEWAARRGTPDAWKQYWMDPGTKYVAFIGKDNVVFHAIVFPAMLMAWNDWHDEHYVLPANIPANEFLNFEGDKFSKSRGWGIDVQDFLARYPADTLRYYLTFALPEYRDSDFTWNDFQAKTNNELADILGNFVNRTLQFVGRSFGGKMPPLGTLEKADEEMMQILKRTPEASAALFEQYRFRDGVLEIMNLARAANKYFNDSEPWKTAKSNPARCATAIHLSVQITRALAVLMSPVIPFACEKVWAMLNLAGTAAGQSWDRVPEPAIKEGHRLGNPEILFSKIDDEVIAREKAALGKTAPVPAANAAPAKPPVTIEEFGKIDLRVAKILEAEKVPKSEKLLKLQVEIGTERRQILAGIARHYTPADLVGKSIVVVFNLQPAKLMGHESQGMVLAASDSEGRLVFIAPSAEIGSGSVVR
jgi:methionyl-tRNA synthetase